MPDAYTGVGASNWDQGAYELRAFYALRAELYWDATATVGSTNQTSNGASVTFTQTADLAAATVTLAESTDVSAVAMSDSQVTATLAEYGNAVKTTAKLRGSSMIAFDPIVANVIGYNAGLSLDEIASIEIRAGSNVRYATGGNTDPTSRDTVQPEDVLVGDDVRHATAKLRGANSRPFGGYYLGYMHPDVSFDFRGGTGTTNWRDPHTYSSPEGIWNGEVGAWEGVRFIETSRAPVFADAGSSTTLTDVYATIIIGQEALAKAYSYMDGNGPFPTIVPGPVTDALRRFVPMGWYWFGAYKRFREACIRRIESSSSIGSN